MKFIVYGLGFILNIFFVSCNNEKEENSTKEVHLNNKEIEEKKNETTTIDIDSIIHQLQGEWKEPEYPFRRAHFKNTKVRFIEEGVAEEPIFREYKIAHDCPYKVNNIKTAGSDVLFLVMGDTRTCEKLKIFSDSLTLSGFSTNTNSDYKIVYYKVD